MSALRDWACECTSRRCRERIYLTTREYGRLSALGRVVTPEHKDGEVVARVRTAVVVR